MKKNVSLTVSAGIVRLSVMLGSFCLLPVSCSKKEPPLLLKTDAFTATDNWPQFRGVRAGGIAESMDTPVTWDVEKGTHIKWKAPVPGLGHSSPVIWENRVFLTSAVSENKDPILTPGIFGESPDNPEDYPHDYKLFCFDKNSGKLVWEKTANTAIPRVHRHIKSSHANSSPATDGKHVVAFFGSEGLYCYDMDGNPEWKKDFGLLDAGAFDAPEVQWGFGSSPVIHRDRVIVLCDVNNQSFLTALNVETGEELWRTLRDEVSTWGTPAVHEGGDRTQIIVNGWKHIGSYDFETGEELWKMKGGGDVPIPTPVIAHDRVYITNAHGRMRPIYAVRLDAAGDITLAQGETSNAGVAWMDPRRGTYINTPILWNEYLYILEWNGVFTCYKAQTGEQVYRERAGGSRSSFIASPVASGNRLYLADEYGNVHVVQAGPVYKLLASNSMGDLCHASPAVSGNILFIRTTHHLYALEKGSRIAPVKKKKEAEKPGLEEAPGTSTEFTLPEGELSDPAEILKVLDQAVKNVKTVQYQAEVRGTGAMESQITPARVTILATGYAEGWPEKFIAKGVFQSPRTKEEIPYTAGSDGSIYYLINHKTKVAHQDFDFSVMGQFARPVLSCIIREFHLPVPYDSEIDAPVKELRGMTRIGDEECYEIRVVYDEQGTNETLWFISKRDYLPRGRSDLNTLPDGSKGWVEKKLLTLTADPLLKKDTFIFKVPEGYTKSGQVATY